MAAPRLIYPKYELLSWDNGRYYSMGHWYSGEPKWFVNRIWSDKVRADWREYVPAFVKYLPSERDP